MLLAWNNKLTTTSIEATIYVNWERTIIREFHDKYVPKNVRGLLNIQLFKIIEESTSYLQKNHEFLKNTFISSNKELESKFGTETSNWLYGQDEYKHIKIKHPLEHIVNDSIYKLVSFKPIQEEEIGHTRFLWISTYVSLLEQVLE